MTQLADGLQIINRFEALLDDYYGSSEIGKALPSVQYFADMLCLSANYLSDLMRKETGESTLKHIQTRLLNVAKERIHCSNKTVSEISYNLGFQYPQHFCRWFKKMEGCTPTEYRINSLGISHF